MLRGSRILPMLALLLLASITATAQADDSLRGRKTGLAKATNNIYIVQMSDAPVVTYTGDIMGLKGTAPRKGQKIDPNSPDVVSYVAYLQDKHNQALNKVGGGRKAYDYQYTFNGFAAELTPDQVAALKTMPGVVAVTKDELESADTVTTPSFLGLDASNGLWNLAGGVDRAGEDIIIGVVDSGVWAEGLSYSDRTGTNGNGSQDGKLNYQQIPGWHGKCTPGEGFPASMCNQKLIGAQHFNAGWGGDAGVKAQRGWEFVSPRDYNGHGSHTSSTAAGNHAVPISGPLSILGAVNGIAPRARIAMYKALWSLQDGSTANGFTSDLVAAIDQAVADGVDVINYSVSGSSTSFLHPAEVAFLNAAAAGVFVSASAGNSGPSSSTVAHGGPWLTTVAASTHNRVIRATLTLGNGATQNGASTNRTPIGPFPLIDSTAAGLPGASATAVALCFSSTWADTSVNPPVTGPRLDPAKVAGKIVVCDRGVNDRVDKSRAVAEAGGVGMVLVNTSPNTLNADLHSVPTVHVPDTARAAIKTYAATPGATASISAFQVVLDNVLSPAPATASFSSRGPLLAGNGDLLKPDIAAPGVDVIAAVAPPGNAGQLFASYQGTSMAAPHIAGIGALLKQLHPDWSPMMIKSAIMTTAGDVIDGPNTSSTVIFRQGAGQVKPNPAADPGLVFDSNINDWLAFLCGTTTGVAASTCTALQNAGYSTDPTNFNSPSIAIGNLVPATQSVKRRVTNVGQGTATYSASWTGMSNYTISVSPQTFTIQPGATKEITVTFAKTATTPNGSYVGGQLTLTDGTHNARIPMVVKSVPLVAPAQVSGTGGQIDYQVRFGFTGSITTTPRGLVPAAVTAGQIADDPNDSFTPTPSPFVIAIPVTIPAGTTYARFSLFDADVAAGTDLDLNVYKGTTLVGSSGGNTSAEEVNLISPAAGTDYIVYVHGFTVPGSSPFKLHTWLLGNTSAGNMTSTSPVAGTVGNNSTISLTFTNLAPATKYLGSVVYGGTSGLPSPTIVRVDVP